MAEHMTADELLDRVTLVVETTDRDTWWEGPTFRSPDGTQHCVLSHVAQRMGFEAMEQFEAQWSTSYVIGAAVNDCVSERYPQQHPKDRVLAFLADLRSGAQLSTPASMEAAFMAGGEAR